MIEMRIGAVDTALALSVRDQVGELLAAHNAMRAERVAYATADPPAVEQLLGMLRDLVHRLSYVEDELAEQARAARALGRDSFDAVLHVAPDAAGTIRLYELLLDRADEATLAGLVPARPATPDERAFRRRLHAVMRTEIEHAAALV